MSPIRIRPKGVRSPASTSWARPRRQAKGSGGRERQRTAKASSRIDRFATHTPPSPTVKRTGVPPPSTLLWPRPSALPARQGWDPLNPSDGYDPVEGRAVNSKTVAAFLAPYLNDGRFKASDKACAWELLVSTRGRPCLPCDLASPTQSDPQSRHLTSCLLALTTHHLLRPSRATR